jgi:hypothetical protein
VKENFIVKGIMAWAKKRIYQTESKF